MRLVPRVLAWLRRLGFDTDVVRATHVDGIGTVVFTPELTARVGDDFAGVNVQVFQSAPRINERRFVVSGPQEVQ